MNKNNIYGFIPARMASTRFPGKPLYPIAGIPMLGHVIKRAQMFNDWTDLYITTCDKEIESYGKPSGIRTTKANYWVHILCKDEVQYARIILDIPILKKGRGVILQKYRNSCFSDATTFIPPISVSVDAPVTVADVDNVIV